MQFRVIIISLILAIFVSALWYVIPFFQPTSCEELLPEYLQQLSYGLTTIDEVKSLLEDQPNLSNPQQTDGDLSALYWRVNDTRKYYYTSKFRDGRLISLYNYIDSMYNQPTAKKIINCFGEPDFYTARHEPTIHYSIIITYFWYVDKGLLLESVTGGNEGFNSSSKFSSLYIIDPAIPEVMANNALYLHREPFIRKIRAKALSKRIKPWPREWAEVEIIDCVKPASKCANLWMDFPLKPPSRTDHGTVVEPLSRIVEDPTIQLHDDAMSCWQSTIISEFNPTAKVNENQKEMKHSSIPRDVKCEVGSLEGNYTNLWNWGPQSLEVWKLICSNPKFKDELPIEIHVNGIAARALTNGDFYEQEYRKTIFGEGTWPESCYDVSIE